jgi:hypothetical protein
MARQHRMTAARRAALRKAQLASAKKRRRRGNRRVARTNRIVLATGGLGLAAMAAGYSIKYKKAYNQRRDAAIFWSVMAAGEKAAREKPRVSDYPGMYGNWGR